ncbi:SEC-C domain-containing protein [Metaplanococcus flavidus]
MKAYIVKIKMLELEPEVWRRIILPAGATFQKLHAIIQESTNFRSSYMEMTYHFHEFRLPEENLLVTDEPIIYEESKGKKKGQLKVRKPQTLKIDEFLEKYRKLSYTYDFGDNWQFDIELEEIVEDYHFGYPTLLDGAGDAPPEDVGGVPGFIHMKQVLADPQHPDHDHLLWWSKEQNFRTYDRKWTNQILKHFKIQKTEWNKINHVNHEIISDKYLVKEEEEHSEVPDNFDGELFYEYVRACTNLYGIVPDKQVTAIFNKQNPQMYVNLNTFVSLVTSKEWSEQTDGAVLREGMSFVHPLLQDLGSPEKIRQEQAGKDWYMPEKEELLKYTASGYIEKNIPYEELKTALKPNFSKLQPVDVDQVLWNFAMDLQIADSFNTAMTAMLSHLPPFENMEDVNKVAQKAMNFANNQRLWANCGHTPREISRLKPLSPLSKEQHPMGGSNQKMGRNDPCMCGSGKKYKKCCGRGI